MIYWLENIEFEHPWFFLLFGIIPLLMLWKYFRAGSFEYHFPLPSLRGIIKQRSLRILLYKLLPVLRMLALSLFIIAMAKPRLALKEEVIKAEGIDIMLIMDVSGSMLAQDFQPDRLEASKEMAKEFVSNREHDRIGLTVFAGEAFTMSPLTNDHKVVINLIDEMKSGLLTQGTAIGNAVAAAVNRLKESEAESKVAIFLTDGVNEGGYIEPELAMQMAAELGVKIYTIGVGSRGFAKVPAYINRSTGQVFYENRRVTIDENLLRKIAETTGGKYYRAINESELATIYEEIDQLEKTEIETQVFKRYSDEFLFFVIAGILFFSLELLLRYSILKTYPA